MLRSLSLVGLLLAGCVESLTPLDAGVEPDASTTDAGFTDGALEVDASAVVATLSIVHANGEVAGGSLVYDLVGAQGRLLGRADELGRYELRTTRERLLVRHEFDEVQVLTTPNTDTTVVLDPVGDHPETLALEDVGLESLLFPGISEVFPAGDRLFTTTSADRVVRIFQLDVAAQTKTEIYRFDSDARWTTNHLRWLAPAHLLVIHHRASDVLEEWAVRIAVINVEEGSTLGPTEWTPGYPESVGAEIDRDLLDVIVTAPGHQRVEMTHHRFFLRENRMAQGKLLRLGNSQGCRLQSNGRRTYFQVDKRVVAYDVATGTTTTLQYPRLGRNDCSATWWSHFNGLSTHYIENEFFVWATGHGDHLRRPLGWPPSGEASFIGGGSEGRLPFVTTAFEQPQPGARRSMLVIPDRTGPHVALLNLESEFDGEPQLWGPAYPVGDEFVALFRQEFPGHSSFERLFLTRDGRLIRKEQVEFPTECVLLEAGSFLDWPESIDLMNCDISATEAAFFTHGKDKLRRTFFGGVKKGQLVTTWKGLKLYSAGTGNQEGLYAFDPDAIR